MINNYIKIDYSNLLTEQQNYIYFLELDEDGFVDKQLAVSIDGKVIHRITAEHPNGDFRWEFSKFTSEEIHDKAISKEDFYSKWDQ